MEPRGVQFHEREQRTGLKMPIMHLSLATKTWCKSKEVLRMGGEKKGRGAKKIKSGTFSLFVFPVPLLVPGDPEFSVPRF